MILTSENSRILGSCVWAGVHEQRWEGGFDGYGGEKAFAPSLQVESSEHQYHQQLR